MNTNKILEHGRNAANITPINSITKRNRYIGCAFQF